MTKVGVKIKTENDRPEVYYLTLSQAAEISGYTPEHLNLLCRKGVLKAKKIGRNWQTSREWLNDFMFLSKSREKKKYTRRKNKETIKKSVALSIEEPSVVKEKQEVVSPSSFSGEDNFETENISQDDIQEKKSRSGWSKFFLDFSIALLLAFVIFFSVSFFQYSRTKKYLAENNIPENVSEDTFLITDQEGVVRGQEKVKGEEVEAQASSIAKSENFKLKEISFGGVLAASANGENLPIEISDIKSEVFMTKDGKQAQILISWKTNKLAISEISYSKGDIRNAKKLEEKFYGFNHSVVLSKLDLAATYVYQIKAKDRWGNLVTSDKFGIYSGSKMVSVFDLILKAVNETFGWAMKE